MDKDALIAAAKEVFGPPWQVWCANNGGLFNQFDVLAAKVYANNNVYGACVQVSGERATAWRWGWRWVPDDWCDLDSWPNGEPIAPTYNGAPGEIVRGEDTVTRRWNWAWEEIPTTYEYFEITPEEVRQWAEELAANLRANGITWSPDGTSDLAARLTMEDE